MNDTQKLETAHLGQNATEDARLIAAAPDLLAALQGASNVLADIVASQAHNAGTDDEPAWYEDATAMRKCINAAITKATPAA